MSIIVFYIKSLAVKGGGAEKVLATIYNLLSQNQNYQCKLFTLDESTHNFFYRIDNLQSVKTCGANGLAAKMIFFAKIFICCIYYRPVAIVSFNATGYVPMAFFKIFLWKTKIIGSEHASFDLIANSKMKRAIVFLSSFFVDKFTVLSDRILQTFPNWFKRKAVVIENPLQDFNINNGVVSDCTCFKIISVGRLVPEKNHVTLILAISILAKEFDFIELDIYGAGELKALLDKLINELNLEKIVKIRNPVDDLNKIFLNSKLFVLPSYSEGFGLAAAEALCFGIPVVGYKCALGLNDFITDLVNGILIDENPNDFESLANTIRSIISDHNLYMSLKVNCKRPVGFHQNDVILKWISLIES
jgi:glycosyltransferase involved in cell wall biosynthesis